MKSIYIQRQAEKRLKEAMQEIEQRDRIERLARDLDEVYEMSKVTALGKTYAVIPMEIFGEYANVFKAFSWMMTAWNRTINEDVERTYGIELFSAIQPFLKNIDLLSDLFQALLRARSD